MPVTPPDPPPNNSVPPSPNDTPDAQTAADLIREKVARIYGDEPTAALEAAEAQAAEPRSKHQAFMYGLSTSGKDLAAVQTEWHEYYQKLPAAEKHQVWQEFYDSQSLAIHPQAAKDNPQRQAQALAEHKNQVARSDHAKPVAATSPKLRDARSTAEIQAVLRDKVTAGG